MIHTQCIIKNRLSLAVAAILAFMSPILLGACADDSVSASAAHQPEFSSDTLFLGDIWAGELSPTAAIRVYNRNPKGIIISSVAVTGADAHAVSISVDGSSSSFSNVEILRNDSIYILAAARPEHGGEIDAAIELTTNGVTVSVPIKASVKEPVTISGGVVGSSVTIGGDIRVFGELTVEAGATLTLEPGTTLWMHEGAGITVNGALVAEAHAEAPVVVRGDRTGFVASTIPYDIMPGQWRGITVGDGASLSASFVEILNPAEGVKLLEVASASMVNCRVSNSKSSLIAAAQGAELTAAGCEFAEADGALVSLDGASATLVRCTLANNYLFSLPSAPALEGTPASFEAFGCIVYKPGSETSAGFEGTFTRCLFGSQGSDDENFIDCVWGAVPRFMLDLDNYLFDYRLGDDSPAKGVVKESHSLAPAVDRYGVPAPLPAPAGAYN